MFHNFEADTADDLWIQIAKEFELGNSSSQSGRIESTHEILHAALCIKNPRQRWVVSRSPAINPAFAIAEVLWILLGRNDSGFVNYFNTKLPIYSGAGPIYHGAYGHRIRKLFGTDQIKEAFETLKYNPDSRQVVIQIWDVSSDLPQDKGNPNAPDIPCNVCSILKIREGMLEWTQIMRSNDLFRGLPFNIVQFTMIQEVMAGWLGLGVGSYNQISDSLHIYESDKNSILNSKKLENSENIDTFNETYESTHQTLKVMEDLILDCIDHRNSSFSLVSRLDSLDISEAWKNFCSILVAESTRRRKEEDYMVESIRRCSNPLLVEMFQRWTLRFVG